MWTVGGRPSGWAGLNAPSVCTACSEPGISNGPRTEPALTRGIQAPLAGFLPCPAGGRAWKLPESHPPPPSLSPSPSFLSLPGILTRLVPTHGSFSCPAQGPWLRPCLHSPILAAPPLESTRNRLPAPAPWSLLHARAREMPQGSGLDLPSRWTLRDAPAMGVGLIESPRGPHPLPCPGAFAQLFPHPGCDSFPSSRHPPCPPSGLHSNVVYRLKVWVPRISHAETPDSQATVQVAGPGR